MKDSEGKLGWSWYLKVKWGNNWLRSLICWTHSTWKPMWDLIPPNLRRSRSSVWGQESKAQEKGLDTAFTSAGRERNEPLFQEPVGSRSVIYLNQSGKTQRHHQWVSAGKITKTWSGEYVVLPLFSSEREAGASFGCGVVEYSDWERLNILGDTDQAQGTYQFSFQIIRVKASHTLVLAPLFITLW